MVVIAGTPSSWLLVIATKLIAVALTVKPLPETLDLGIALESGG
jgi:hypothetical protein